MRYGTDEGIFYKRLVEVKEHKGKLFPLYFMFDGALSYELVAFYDFEYKRNRGQDDGLTASTVAEIYFYSKNVEHREVYDKSPQSLVLDYAYSRTTDKELWGRLLSDKQVIERVKSLTKLELAMEATFGINVVSSMSLFRRGVRASSAKKMNNTLLAHLKGRDPKGHADSPNTTGSFNVANRSGGRPRLYKAFPPEFAIDLLNSESDPNQKVGYLLQMGAAFRASEALHVLTTDIGFNQFGNKVIFPKPDRDTLDDDFKGVIKRSEVFSKIDQVNPKLEIPANANETDIRKIWFLNNLSERSALPRSHLYWSGYKGVDPQNETTDVGSSIEFTHNVFETLALELIDQELLNQHRVRNHPFLLCDTKGYPLAKQAYERRFMRTVERRYGLKMGPHSLRHFAGCFMANNLEVDIEIAKVLMRHVSLSSTKVYYNLDSVTIRNHLSKDEVKSKFKQIDFSELKR